MFVSCERIDNTYSCVFELYALGIHQSAKVTIGVQRQTRYIFTRYFRLRLAEYILCEAILSALKNRKMFRDFVHIVISVNETAMIVCSKLLMSKHFHVL